MLVMITMSAFGLVSEETCNAKNKETKDNPYGIEHCCCHKDIKNRCPQLAQRGVIVDDGIDIQAYGYHEADEQRQQLGADSAGRNIKIRHFIELKVES